MNSPYQQGHDRPSRPNLFLLFVLGAMALFLYTQYKKNGRQSAIPNIVIPDISHDGNPGMAPSGRANDWRTPRVNAEATRADRDTNDWSIDTEVVNIQSRQNTTATANTSHNNSQDVVQSGDWSLEQGASRPASDPNAKPLGPANSKTTQKGDWTLEEVETN